MTTSAVPFSPVPTQLGDMRFDPEGFVYQGTPMRVLWEQGYRDAAWSLLSGQVERATAEARTARALEFAYMGRTHDECQARQPTGTAGGVCDG